MLKRWRNRKRWAARWQRIEHARAELALEDLTAQLRGRLSVLESRLQHAWERAGMDRLVAAVQGRSA